VWFVGYKKYRESMMKKIASNLGRGGVSSGVLAETMVREFWSHAQMGAWREARVLAGYPYHREPYRFLVTAVLP
jgi:hypothetical protein